MADGERLVGVERAAVLLLSIGEEAAAEVLKHMGPKEVQRVGTTMASLREVSSSQVDGVIDEFIEEVGEHSALGVDSEEFLRNTLVQALGEDKAGAVIDRILMGGNVHGLEALKWMDARKESVASTGWCTYAGIVATTPDDQLDLGEIKGLLKRVVDQIDTAPERVKYTMNGFVIAVGSYVRPLAKQAKATAKKLGKVEVDMHGTTCKVPLATEYIQKVEKAGKAGKKRKTIKC